MKKHAQSRKPLGDWRNLIESSNYFTPNDLTNTFGDNLDIVKKNTGDYYVFDIGGNKYRLITTITFKMELVLIEIMYTHAEYDKWSKKI